MKRFLCVFCVAVIAASLGFAQELKFDGYLNSGLGFYVDNISGNEPYFRVMGVDSEQMGGRLRVNGAFTNADKNAGANFRFQLQGSSVSNLNLGASYAYGWVKFFDMLQIKAGLVDDSVWETAGAILKDDQSEGAGILLRLTPVTGLDIGLGAFAWTQGSGSGNNAIGTPGAVRDWKQVKYTAMASYLMPDVFKINLSGRTFNGSGASTTARALAEFRLLAVKDLTAIIEFEMNELYNDTDHFDRFSTNGKINLYETFAYKVGDFNFGLYAAQMFSNEAAHADPGLRFNLWGSYALADGKLVPRLDAMFFLGGRLKTDRNYDRRTDVEPSYDSDNYIFSARPSLKINLDSRNSFEIGDVIYYGKHNGVVTDAQLTNVFYLDFVLRF